MDIFHQDGTTQTIATSKQDAATQTVQTSIQSVDKRGWQSDEIPVVQRPFQTKITDFAKRIRGAFTPNLKPRKSKFLAYI